MIRLVCIFILLTAECLHASDFLELRKNWSTVCETNNRCPRLHDGSDYLTHVVPWTLTSDTINHFAGGNGSPRCKSVQELLSTIQHPVADYTCQLPWMSNEEICSLLNQYSKILWYGDSLMRHMSQTFHMLLKQDLQHGGYPARINNADVPYKYCSCDGQFSESKMCRNYPHEFGFTDMTAQLGVCQGLKDTHPKTEFAATVPSGAVPVPQVNVFTSPPSTTCKDDARPAFILMEGGLHYGTHGQAFINKFLRPMMHLIHNSTEYCRKQSEEVGRPHRYKVHIAVIGVVYSSEAVVKSQPMQSAERTAAYYEEVTDFLSKEFPHVVLMNFLSLSKEGTLAGRGDGVHSLTDINLIKTQIVLNAMKLFL